RIATDSTLEAEEQPVVESDPLAIRYDDVTGIDEAQEISEQGQLQGVSDPSVEATAEAEVTAESDINATTKTEPPITTASIEEDDLIDEEIIEIFLEEAEEVLETIHEFWPQYKTNQNDD